MRKSYRMERGFKKAKGILCLLLTLALLMGVLPSMAWAEDDVIPTPAPETESQDIVTTNPTIVSEEQETAENSESDDGGEGLLPGLYLGINLLDARAAIDVTGYIIFSNGQLSMSSGTEIDEGQNITFQYGSYAFSTDWEVNFASLAADSIELSAGDYFTFTVPGAFGNLSFNLTVGGDTWATVTVNSSGAGKVTFTGAVEGLTSMSGSLTIEGSYSEVTQGRTVEWIFEFGTETYTYNGGSAGRIITNNTYTDDNRKSGAISSGNIYYWRPYLNMQGKNWTGRITVQDSLGENHKMIAYAGSTSTSAYGYYGTENYSQANSTNTTYYFAISIINWDTMRADYNAIIQDNIAHENTTIWYTNSNGIYVDSGYTLTGTITSGYTSFMINVMRSLTSGGVYKYLSPYTGGLESVSVTDGGFTIVFPDGAFNGKSMQITYYTELTSPITPTSLKNSVSVSGEDFTQSTSTTATVKGSGTIKGVAGKITLYKYDSEGRNALSGASFALKKGNSSYAASGTTDENGKTSFTLQSDGINGYGGSYNLMETVAPERYAALEGPITFEINSAGEITKVNDTNIPENAENGTTVYDGDGNKLCLVSSDRLALIVYNYSGETPVGETIDISVIKKWSDADNQDGIRSKSVMVQLYANETAYGDPVTLTAETGWRYTWLALPRYEGEAEIAYTVKEFNVPNGYTVSYSESEGSFTITNHHTPTSWPTATPLPLPTTSVIIPATGEGVSLAYWLAAALLSGCGLLFIRVSRRSKGKHAGS